MSVRCAVAIGPAVLSLLLAACAQTPDGTGTGGQARQGDGEEVCTNRTLDAASPAFNLPGEIPVWSITNSGPATLILRAAEDPSLAAPFPPKADGRALFAGGPGFTYRLELEPSGATAKVRVCWTEAKG